MQVESESKYLMGFAGKMGVGKTTTANWFVEQHDFKRLYFAKPLKESLSVLTGLPIEYFTDIELKELIIPGLKGCAPDYSGITTRIMMQKFGTDFVRDMIDPNFWIWRMTQMISEHSDRNIVIDDVRFENEAQLIRDLGGTVIHLTREFESPSKQSGHISENSLKEKSHDIIVPCDISEELTAINISQLIFKE